MTTELDPRGNAVQVGGLKIRAPGLRGYAEVVDEGVAVDRGEIATTKLDAELAKHGFHQQESVVLREVESLNGSTDSEVTARSEDESSESSELKIVTTAPAEGWGQLVVTQQGNLVTFEFPDEAETQDIVDRAGGELTYSIDLPVPPASDEETVSRGIIGKIAKKVIKVLAFRVAAEVGEGLVARWEANERKHKLRELMTATIKDPNAAALDESRWRELSNGPVLLLIHGTNSQIHTGYHALPEDQLDLFRDRYGTRVIGFDHPTVSVSPVTNIDSFMEIVPRGIELDLDIVCHSRGGLVARELAQRPRPGSGVKVQNVVFVATPNAGTSLADSKHLKKFINTYTGFLNFVPDNVFTTILDVIVTLAKEVAIGIHSKLEGLQAMDPKGQYLKELNEQTGAPPSYAAVATNFEPAGFDDFALWARDQLLDKVFGKKVNNDLVVPTDGCFDVEGAAGFPITNRLVFEPADAVHHSSFFGNPRVLEFLGKNLTGTR